MAKKKITKSAKRRLTILVPIVILAVGYFAFTVVMTATQLYELHTKENSLISELNELKGDSKELKTEITKLQDKEYVARYAREQYLYTKDGEYVIKTDDTKENKDNTTKFKIDTDYIIYGSFVILMLIILYVIIKGLRNRKKVKQNKKREE